MNEPVSLRVQTGENSSANGVVPRGADTQLPVVALTGAAGSLPALASFFGHMPPDSGSAFVVLLQGSAAEDDMLPRKLGGLTPMPVVLLDREQPLRPDTVFLAPPGRLLRTAGTRLVVGEPADEAGHRQVADQFFRALAETHGPQATAVVLSGTGSDGAIGLKTVKERGGLTIAQDPDDAEQGALPREAIATGMVDWVLGTAEMPARLLGYRQIGQQLSLPAPDDRRPTGGDLVASLVQRDGVERRETSPKELETELQSMNEELLRVNMELQSKVEGLARANSDMQNLLDSTAIATVFLDRRLCITRYTPPAITLFNLIPSDIGRPLTDVTGRLDYPELSHDVQLVLERLAPLEREVGRTGGNWYLARVLPCRTMDQLVVGVVLSFVDITARKRAEEELRRTRDELEISVQLRTAELERANASLRVEVSERRAAEMKVRQLMAQLLGAEEEERRRIARELHDTLGQHLAVLGIGLKGIELQQGDAGALNDKLRQVQRTALLLERDVDRLAHELRPPALDDLGLEDAVCRHVQTWAEESGLEVDVHTRGLRDERFAGAVETTAYRVVQEALTNVLKHAQAQRISVIAEHVAGELRVIVEDDGTGFDAEQVKSSHGRQLGLTGMAERAALVGGRLEIESELGKGTTVYLRVPTAPLQNAAEPQ